MVKIHGDIKIVTAFQGKLYVGSVAVLLNEENIINQAEIMWLGVAPITLKIRMPAP